MQIFEQNDNTIEITLELLLLQLAFNLYICRDVDVEAKCFLARGAKTPPELMCAAYSVLREEMKCTKCLERVEQKQLCRGGLAR